VNEEGKPKPIPAYIPKTEEEIRLESYAKKLMELRQGIEKEMEPYLNPVGQ
jgi:acyl-CoA hydrolase